MTLEEYLEHYLSKKEMLMFGGVALVGALLSMVLVVIWVKLTAGKEEEYEVAHNKIQRFYEMIFSATSILSFLSAYYIIDRFVLDPSFRGFWDKYSDMLLLVMICISCLVNNFLDFLLIPLKKISKSEKASVRLIGMLYIILIFMYIKFIYENNNYDGFIMYFVGLMVGRFVYFDASIKDFFSAIADAFKNFPLMLLGLAYTGFMCLYGFGTKYLLKSNGVLVSTFIAHIFMIVAIFIVHHLHVMSIFIRKKKSVDID